MAYATIEDIEQRWRKLTVAECDRAQYLIDDAVVLIETLLTNQKKSIADVDPNLLKMVICSMVSRVLDSGTDTGLYSAKTESAGVYSHTFTYAQTGNNLYLARKEKALLGLSGLRISQTNLGG